MRELTLPQDQVKKHVNYYAMTVNNRKNPDVLDCIMRYQSFLRIIKVF